MRWVIVTTFAVVATILLVSTTRQPAELHAGETLKRCEDLLKSTPDVLFETAQIYKYLRQLDASDCQPIGQEAFDEMVDRVELNIVSYSLLEERLAPSAPALRNVLLSNYAADYEAAQTEMDINALLPLVDAHYYPCNGDAACIGERVVSLIGKSARLAPEATCLFGLAGVCPSVSTDMPLVNDQTIAQADDTSAMEAARHAFICTRYQQCPNGSE